MPPASAGESLKTVVIQSRRSDQRHRVDEPVVLAPRFSRSLPTAPAPEIRVWSSPDRTVVVARLRDSPVKPSATAREPARDAVRVAAQENVPTPAPTTTPATRSNTASTGCHGSCWRVPHRPQCRRSRRRSLAPLSSAAADLGRAPRLTAWETGSSIAHLGVDRQGPNHCVRRARVRPARVDKITEPFCRVGCRKSRTRSVNALSMSPRESLVAGRRIGPAGRSASSASWRPPWASPLRPPMTGWRWRRPLGTTVTSSPRAQWPPLRALSTSITISAMAVAPPTIRTTSDHVHTVDNPPHTSVRRRHLTACRRRLCVCRTTTICAFGVSSACWNF